jgi:hypothetical protein
LTETARSVGNGAAEVVRVSEPLGKTNREREKQREEEIRGEEEELGEGGLLLHATTARQGGDERVEGDPGNGARSLEQRKTTATFLQVTPCLFLFPFIRVLFYLFFCFLIKTCSKIII